MALDWNSFITSMIGGGIIGSVVGPYINWRIEKVRLLHQSRKEKIQSWRASLETAKDFVELRRTLLWEELRPYLTESEQEQMLIPFVVAKEDEEVKLSRLLGVVAKIQKEWGII